MKPSPYHGFLVIDKPGGITSRDAVDRAQCWFPRGTKLGHTGTLDPLATGVLVLAVGSGARLTEYVQQMDKTYQAGVQLGARSDTDDADGTITSVPNAMTPERSAVERELRTFLGEIEQVPPVYSAAKVSGRRAYDLARRGAEVSLQARRVRIYGIDVLTYTYPRLELEVRCGKGTYIRSLARDLGKRLGCGAYIASLRRTRVGPFEVSAALRLETDAATARAHLLPLATGVTGLPRVSLGIADVTRLRRGQSVAANLPDADGEIAVFDPDGRFAAVAVLDGARRMLKPVKVLVNPPDAAGT
jgi:tRNA pseudouridine55 synthase